MVVKEKVNLEESQGNYYFARGTANPIGLNLEFYSLSDVVFSKITLDKVYEGWQNMAHGGIISTLLDEVMAWAIFYSKRIPFVTRKIEIKYIKPVLIGTPLTIRGRLIDDSKPPKIRAKPERPKIVNPQASK